MPAALHSQEALTTQTAGQDSLTQTLGKTADTTHEVVSKPVSHYPAPSVFPDYDARRFEPYG